MRVRLLNPVLITVQAIDPTATRALDPPGPEVSGYDDVWRSPNKYVDPATKEIESSVQYQTLTFLAQVESNKEHLARYDATGDMPEYDLVFVAHIKDLTNRGYIKADGSPLIKIGDKISQSQNRRNLVVQATWDDLEIIEWRHASWGFGAGRDLILFLTREGKAPA